MDIYRVGPIKVTKHVSLPPINLPYFPQYRNNNNKLLTYLTVKYTLQKLLVWLHRHDDDVWFTLSFLNKKEGCVHRIYCLLKCWTVVYVTRCVDVECCVVLLYMLPGVLMLNAVVDC